MGNVESSSAEPGKNDKYIEEQKRIIKAQQDHQKAQPPNTKTSHKPRP